MQVRGVETRYGKKFETNSSLLLYIVKEQKEALSFSPSLILVPPLSLYCSDCSEPTIYQLLSMYIFHLLVTFLALCRTPFK